MLVRNLISDRIPIPGEEGQWMRFRRLNDRRMQEIVDAKAERGYKLLAGLGPDEIKKRRELQDAAQRTQATEPTGPPPRPTIAQALAAYDRDTLLLRGIAEWSYEQPIAEALKDEDGGLDAATSRWAAIEILRYNQLLPEDLEAQEKN